MSGIRPSLAVLVALAVVVAGVGSVAVVAPDVAAEDDEESERPMGAELSSFMQSSTADAGQAVTTGMFVAAYEDGDAERREAAVAERTAELEADLAALRSERDRLADRTEASSIADRPEASSTAYTAQLTRLEAEIEALERALDELEPRADEVGTETGAVAELRTETEELAESSPSVSGAEMTAVGTP